MVDQVEAADADEPEDPFIDSLEQALAVSSPKKKRGPKSRLEDVVRRCLRSAERMARKQRKNIETSNSDPRFVAAFNDTAKSIANLSETLRRIHESERKAFGGLTEEQLDQVFVAQLGRIAGKLNDAERRMILEIWFGKEVADVLLQTSAPAPADEGAVTP